ncbi:MAG TPA: ABC transporter permease [Candidatus Sulfotelmatobacter sp.]|nr:ABC transporter permease [Candidatus Sulfotelmatobacter sp.]
MSRHAFSFYRFGAVIIKEFIQMRRDRLTFAMMVGVPMIQLILFGFAINSNPKHLPTAVYAADNSTFSRTIIWGLRNSSYFDITREAHSAAEIEKWLAENQVQFAVTVPVDFSRKLLRGEKPDLLLEADATDPSAVGFANAAVSQLATTVINRDLTGPLAKLQSSAPPFNIVSHQHYNPESISQYNIVPGLIGVMLTMTMIMTTGLAITRERERGTMENLLSTPVHPGEVILGKIVPYILVGYIQMTLVLLAAKFIFSVPIIGSVPLLVALTFLFLIANLSVGITFSTVAKNQLQAVQMAFFYFLPNMLLSGYMFPFRGMPGWAQDIGECLPLTHFLRIVRGILLKGNGLAECLTDLWPIALFVVAALTLAVKRYRQTLD